ncbi:MAG: thermopsin family protease [Nitrososphaerales archaeon]
MKQSIVLVLWLMLLLVPTSQVRTSPGSPFSSLPYEVALPAGYFEPVPLQAYSNATVIQYQVQSNVSISTAFMNSTQFSSFNDSVGQVSDSVFYQNGTNSQHTFHVGDGLYYLVFYAYSGAANVTYSYDILPVSPLQYGPLVSPQPTGIASFGLYNESGNLVPYSVQTDEVVGAARISALSAYNATAASADSAVSGATLQLNAMLVVQQTDGLQQTYWCQNIPDFVTATLSLAASDNLWNASINGFLSNDSVTSEEGLGAVYSIPSNGGTQYYYSYGSSNSSYSLPLDLDILMKETVSQGEGVVVQMGMQVLRNGTGPSTPISWFDNSTIHDSGVQDAYFLTTGNQTTPDGLFYDTELAFGGEANGESTFFTQMNATLGLFYASTSNGVLTAFPSYFSYGWDTVESADNLRVTKSGNGSGQVSTGIPDYIYLGTASGTLGLGTSTATGSSSTVSGSTTSLPSASSTNSNPGVSSGVPEFPIQIGVSLVATAVIMVSYLLVRHFSHIDSQSKT